MIKIDITISTKEQFIEFFGTTIQNNTSEDSDEVNVIITNDIDFEGAEMPNFGKNSASNITSIYNVTIKSNGNNSYRIHHFIKYVGNTSSIANCSYILGNYTFRNCTIERIIFDDITIHINSTNSSINRFYSLCYGFVGCEINRVIATGIKTDGFLNDFSFPVSYSGLNYNRGNNYNYCAITSSEIKTKENAYIFVTSRSTSSSDYCYLNNCISAIDIIGDPDADINIKVFYSINGRGDYKYCIAKNRYYNIQTSAAKNADTGINEFFNYASNYFECYSASRFIDCKEANILAMINQSAGDKWAVCMIKRELRKTERL